ncbi:hypothetical protein ALO95_100481 [Pseudomonas syringae pv. antirrhini]|uniref:Uncharacterized protein n=1 Tax=Pseudomonas syringae pv. antirrhini TaxID=251702 RepID=A0A0P9P640_9PSED|nr:hypothetical protein ALO87_100565 [Pseudomonas syringae pv. apii]KPW52260.1 hypothetical protein ALO88_100574 [Pseudomonas syringae pv. antirrhini]POQ02562.1 hypothetical protein CXB40_23080 [Pseudomonas syringae pv. avii]RMR18870.1 hypothetical protein ALP89_100539 [Pseudomonas syringae pv. persicae]RMP31064.1 hypothetical protein ALQ24_100625 [Pseudomonas syringae pv. antirrhini]
MALQSVILEDTSWEPTEGGKPPGCRAACPRTLENSMKKSLIPLSLALILSASFASAGNWPPETSAKVPGNALEYPTKLEAVNVSMEEMLNAGATVVSSYVAENGPVVTLNNKKHYVICMLRGAGTGSDTNVATSKCYAMN